MTYSTPPDDKATATTERLARQALKAALETVVVAGEVDISNRRRAEYSTDASNYRVVPDVVVQPANTDELTATLEVLRELAVPVTLRGAGTSVAGNAVGPGAVIDTSRYLNRVLALDPEKQTARVEPGCIMGTLQEAAAEHDLRFGPDPSTWNRATLGGMIGNNACGPHAVAYGRTADNVLELDCLDGAGRRFTAGSGDPKFKAVPGLAKLVRENLALIRTEFGKFSRQVSGYSLEHLLPENGSDLAKALVGTEGTCVTVLEATLKLVPKPASPSLIVLGYTDMATAADDVPALLAPGTALAIEGLDARLVDVVRAAHGAAAVPPLPDGAGWLMLEALPDDVAGLIEAASALDSATFPAGPDADRMWRIRADGAGLAGRTPRRPEAEQEGTVNSGGNNPAWPGWEDSAVPPANLGAYLRDLDALMEKYGVDGLPYGHFGDGCVHLRIDFPLDSSGSVLRTFMLEAAELVAKHGGSLSGEHGDGRARSELLPVMFSPEAIALLEQFKALFDPQDLLNPGVVVRPAPLDVDLRRPQARPTPAVKHGFTFHHDDGDLTKAVHRCVSVGKCRADLGAAGGFMCPSYQATKDEKDVTRGRARVLQEAVNGRLIGGLAAKEVRESLDLCLSCKACSADCPAGVDMAQFKSEVLNRTYKNRVRPVDHYVLGWLPRWTRLIGPFAGPVNKLFSVNWIAKTVFLLGGMDPRRKMMTFAKQPFRKWWKAEGPAAVEAARSQAAQSKGKGKGKSKKGKALVRPQVVLWTDSFSEGLAPNVPQAAIKVLTSAGFDVVVPEDEACCGLTWISTGQLSGAKRRLMKLLDVLGPYAVNGIPIMGLEPSCTGVLRSDLLDFFPDDPRAQAVAAMTRTVAELLTEPATAPKNWKLPDLSDLNAVVQPHCHHHSVMGFAADRALLENAGAKIEVLAGCCGLAGNFGMQRGHYDLSVAVAENALLPALRAADERDDGTEFVADGFSCRTQAVQLAGVEGKALIEVLAERL